MTRLYALLLLSIGLLAGFLGGAALTTAYSQPQQFDYTQVVAQFGETKITRGRLAEYALAQNGMVQLAGTLRSVAVVEEAARKQGVTVSADEIKQRIDEVYALTESDRERRALDATPSWLLEENMRTRLQAEKLMGLALSDNEVSNYYTSHPQQFFRPAQADLICIATSNRTDALTALNRLKDGEDPEKLAQQYSSEKVLREAKGHLGWTIRDMLNPEAAEAIFDANKGLGMKPKQFTNVIQTKDGNQAWYLVFYVTEMRPNFTPTLEQIRPAVQYIARTEKFEKAAPQWFKEQFNAGEWLQVGDLFNPASPLKVTKITEKTTTK